MWEWPWLWIVVPIVVYACVVITSTLKEMVELQRQQTEALQWHRRELEEMNETLKSIYHRLS